MISNQVFYGVLLLFAVLGLTLIFVDRREQRRIKKVAMSNTYLQARQRDLDAKVNAVVYPTKFQEQNARRRQEDVHARRAAVDDAKRFGTASKERVN